MGSGSSASKKKYTQLSDVKASEQGEGAERKALFIGATVRLCGLKAAPELNDCLASVVKFDPSKGRWTVRLETGEEKAVKPENAVVEPIQIGGAVRITGLKKETVLNGMVGIAESYEKSSGRYTVKLSGGVKKAMKASNLVAVVVGPADTRTAEEKRRESEERIHSTGSFHDLEDAPLEIALRSGEIRLVRGSYFRRRFEEGLPWQPREAMREEDFWPPEEASKMWSLWRSNFFIAVSYSWLSSKHSDPNMYHLERLAHVIKNWLEGPPLVLHNRNLSGNKEDEPLPEDVGVFLDFACLHQKKDVSSTAEELQQQAAMKLVGCIYGHANFAAHHSLMASEELRLTPKGPIANTGSMVYAKEDTADSTFLGHQGARGDHDDGRCSALPFAHYTWWCVCVRSGFHARTSTMSTKMSNTVLLWRFWQMFWKQTPVQILTGWIRA